jgi:hypothetical protein
MSKTNGAAPDIKPLDLAWAKITKGKQQEEKGRQLWLEGAIELNRPPARCT